MDNNNPEIFKYFKVGDTVLDFPHSCWGNTKFTIRSFHGNAYLPLASVHQIGKPDTNRYMCNFSVREMRLVGAVKRPFRKTDKGVLIKMMNKGVVEAKREFMIRLNTKTL